MANISESKFQKECIDLCRNNGCYVYKNAQSMYTEKGRPDLTVCVPITKKRLLKLLEYEHDDTKIGIYMGLEVKVDKNKYSSTKAQNIVGRKIASAGGLWYSIDKKDSLKTLLLDLQGKEDDI